LLLTRRQLAIPPVAIHPWTFGFLSAPGGIFYWGISALLVPYLLRAHGVSVDRIAGVAAVATLPNLWSFLTSPIIDLGLRRRTWILLFAALTALCGWLAITGIAGSLAWLTVFLFAGNIAQCMIGNAVGALMSTVEPSVRGRAGGWYQAGNIGGGSLVGGALIGLAGHIPLSLLALVAALATFGPALVVLFIHETPLPHLAPKPLFAALFHDVWDVLRARRTWLGLAFFCSPAGTGALGNLISGVGPDYHVSGGLVAWLTGPAGSVLMGVGCAVGGWICDRIHRKTCYALFGLANAASAAILWLGPLTPSTYTVGLVAYSFTVGLVYAAFSSLVLEVLGHRRRGAATGYALLYSSGNLGLIYMTWLDGFGYRQGGARGLMATEILAGGIGSLILLWIARHALRRWRHLTDLPGLPAARPTAR
jgi:MFS family permease